jgi:uncharacterized protein YdaU (DUF1376 family)
MDNQHQNNGELRARAPWFKCYPQDWIEATRGLTLEQRAVYFDCLCIIYQFERPLPADEKWMSHQLHISTRLWRSIRDALLASGKLVECEGGYTNARAQLEIGSRSVRTSNQPRTKSENSKKPNDFYAGAHAQQSPDTDTERKIPAQQVDRLDVAALPNADLKALTDRLISSCNGALDNPVNCLGLLNLSTPRMWLDSGCDLERDVIPTLEAIGKRDHGKRIRSWDYFTNAVAQAKAKRLAGMPSVTVKPTASSGPVLTVAPKKRSMSDAELEDWKDKIGREMWEADQEFLRKQNEGVMQ